MIFPLGLEELKFTRVPWVSLGLFAACCATTVHVWRDASNDPSAPLQAQLAQVLEENSDVTVPPACAAMMGGVDREEAPRPGLEAFTRTDQRRADDLCREITAVTGRAGPQAWGLTPNRGFAQRGFWTHHVVQHGPIMLLAVAFWFFLYAIAVEEVWGHLLFGLMLLLAGLLTSTLQVLLGRTSALTSFGAGGLVAACVGAFAFTFPKHHVRVFFSFFWIFFVRVFHVSGAWWATVWLLLEVPQAALLAVRGDWSRVADLCGWGVGFGLGVVAARFKWFPLSAYTPDPDTPTPVANTLVEKLAVVKSRRVKAGLRAELKRDFKNARVRYRDALEETPSDQEALWGLARCAAALGDDAGLHRDVEKLLLVSMAQGVHATTLDVVQQFGGAVSPGRLKPSVGLHTGRVLIPVSARDAELWLKGAASGADADALQAAVELCELQVNRLGQFAAALATAQEAITRPGLSAEQRARLLDVLGRSTQESSGLAFHAVVEAPSSEVAPWMRAEQSGQGWQQGEAPQAPPSDAEWLGGVDPQSPLAMPAAVTSTPATVLPPRFLWCRIAGRQGPHYRLEPVEGGAAWDLEAPRLKGLRLALVASLPSTPNQPRTNILVIDLQEQPLPGQPPRVLRLASDQLGLASVAAPGTSPREALSTWVKDVLQAAGLPAPAGFPDGGYPRFANLMALERAWYSPVADAGPTPPTGFDTF